MVPEELLTIYDAAPCPFCGHAPVSGGAEAGCYWVECRQSGCVRPMCGEKTLARAVAVWNKRIRSEEELSAMVLVRLEEQAKEMGYRTAKEALEALAELRVVLAMAVGDAT